ncbi:hypothetical protein [Lentilactobacillus kosonis]|uniref:Uncharacterized protein n=1 Tax=Lentilactobacillus kosonis TaxID=2810561 RepID=A0A401FIR2_9LACO|nr:hypothetical protein [Lentilactobacillus kosonis]GAY72188.1 hypothetical protein NBRC111893_334 [Lentilactobacillus kosonis]
MVPESVRIAIEERRHPSKPADDLINDDELTNHIYHIDRHNLNLFALTSLGILPILAVLGAVYGRVQEAIPDRYLNKFLAAISHESALIIAVAVVILLILGMVISYFMTILNTITSHYLKIMASYKPLKD